MAVNFKELIKPKQVDSVEAAQRRLQIAQALQERALQGMARVPTGGRVQAVYGPGHALTDIAAAWVSSRGVSDAERELKRQQDLQTAKNADVARALSQTRGQIMDVESGAMQPMQSVGGQVQGQQIAEAISALAPDTQEKLIAAMLQSKAPQQPIALSYGTKLVSPDGRVLASNERQEPTQNLGDRMRWIYDYMNNNGASLEEATRAYNEAFRKIYMNATVGNVPGRRDNLQGVFIPDTDIGTIADNAARVKAAESGGQVQGRIETERILKAPSAKVQAENAISKTQSMAEKARAIKDNPDLWRATGFMAYVPSVFGGAARDIENAIESLKAELGFNELLALKSAGGTLGQVAIKEGEWLQSAFVNLARSTSPEQFRRNLQSIIDRSTRIAKGLDSAYKAEFGPYENAPKPVERGNRREIRWDEL